MEFLFDYQIPHVDKLVRVLQTRRTAADLSDPGVGKTICAVAIAKELGLSIFVIGPKCTLVQWCETAAMCDVEICGVVNYESAIRRKYYTHRDNAITESRDPCPYITEDFRFELPPCLLIFDEVHRTNNHNTAVSKLIKAAYYTPVKTLVLSGTVADKLPLFYSVAVLLEICPSGKRAYTQWLKRIGGTPEAINAVIAPVSSRIRKSDLAHFPENRVYAQVFPISPEIEIEIIAAYAEIEDALRQIAMNADDMALVRLLRARQKIELLKVPTLVMKAMELVDGGNSVVIFINYNQTKDSLFEPLDKFVQEEHQSFITFINGNQSNEERQYNINAFQADRSRICIANVKAGREGLTLSDIHGRHPRKTLISPPWSSTELTQLLGRIHRANSRSFAEQIIVYLSGCTNAVNGNDSAFNNPEKPNEKMGVEELLAIAMNRKLRTLELLNNGDVRDLKQI